MQVSGVRRVLTVNADGNKMEYRLDMAAVAQPMQLHLEATLHRVSQRGDLVITVDGAKQDRDSVMFLDIREGSEKESVPPIPGMLACFR
jgi:hypothetical protein